MEKPPMEWVDKFFNCMVEFYGERWTKQFTKTMTEDLMKTVWQSALQGLTYEEIRKGLIFDKKRSKYKWAKPPTHLNFYCSI